VLGSCGHVNKLSGSIQCLENLQWPSSCWLLKDSLSSMKYLRAHYCGHTCSSWLCILRQTDQVQTLPNYFFKVFLNSILPSTLSLPSGLLLSCFPSKTLYAFLTLACVLHYLTTSLSYIIYQTVIMSTRKCKSSPHGLCKQTEVCHKIFVSLAKTTDI
jgi:hypothetical protein